jgi:hypothetical protein
MVNNLLCYPCCNAPTCFDAVALSSGVRVQWRSKGGFGVFIPLSPQKFRGFDKAEPNFQFRGKYSRKNLIRKRVSLICKLSRNPDEGVTAPRSPFSLPSRPQLNLCIGIYSLTQHILQCDDKATYFDYEIVIVRSFS